MIKTIFLLIIACFSQAVYSQITLKEINIESELYGPFSKNTAELVLYNDNKEAMSKGFFAFNLNNSAIITGLWIDTGERITKITEGKDDPLTIKKNMQNTYSLSINPSPIDIKRIIIEYLSVLETSSNRLCWYIDIKKTSRNPVFINLITKAHLLPETQLKCSGKSYIINNDEKIELSGVNELKMEFIFPFNRPEKAYEKMILISPGKQLFTIGKPLDQVFDYDGKGNIPEFLTDYIIHIISYDFRINIKEKDRYLCDFLSYIEKNYPSYSAFYKVFAGWYIKNESYSYLDDNVCVSVTKSLYDCNSYPVIECPFLDKFTRYNDILETNKNKIEEQQESKNSEFYCISNTFPSNGSFRFGDPEQIEIVFKKTPPQYVDELSRLFGVSGEVFADVFFRYDGTIAEVEIKKSLHPFFDKLACDFIRQWEFTPASANNKPVSIWSTHLVKIGNNNAAIFPKQTEFYELLNRQIKKENNILCESGCNTADGRTFELYSTDFYDLLMQDPTLVEITYLFSLQDQFDQIILSGKNGETLIIEK